MSDAFTTGAQSDLDLAVLGTLLGLRIRVYVLMSSATKLINYLLKLKNR